MQLFVVRHGESANNALTDLSQRSMDPKLTENGERQIVHAAQFIADGRHLTPGERAAGGPYIDHLYCSPMWRCLRTVQPIGEATGLAPEVWVDIHESGGIFLDHGGDRGIVGYPGMTRTEMLNEFPGYTLSEQVSDQGFIDRLGRVDVYRSFTEQKIHADSRDISNMVVVLVGEQNCP